MGNSLANSNMEIEQRLNGMREQMKERRKAMIMQRDSMRVGINANREERRAQMEERKEAMKARMNETRSLQGRAYADSMRFKMGQRRDSLKAQMMERRNEMRSARGRATQTSDKADAGYIKLNGDTYYYVNKDNGSVAYYDRWGNEIKEADEKYEALRTAANSSIPRDNVNSIITNLQKKNKTRNTLYSQALFIINNKPANEEMLQSLELDPNDIDNISVLKGKAATDLYGDDGKNGVIIIELKKGHKPTGGQKLFVSSGDDAKFLNQDGYTKITITKNTTKDELDGFKSLFSAKGIDYKYYKLKRNKSDEIVRIEVSLQSNGNASSSKFGDGKTPIADITVGYSND